MFAIVKRYFDRGIYNAEDVYKFVQAGKLTEEEYKQITGTGEGTEEGTEEGNGTENV